MILMNNFEKRRDRFAFFDNFENPLLNLTFRLEVPDFLTYCKTKSLPPFHFFLFHLFQAAMRIENLRYRIYQGEVIEIARPIPSYTVLNKEGLFNYTRFEYSEEREVFIKRSLVAKDEAMNATHLIHTGVELDERSLKNYIFITSIPWFDFTSIQHPVFKFKSADIPSIAWGKFTKGENGTVSMPFSVQAHHGFVDGYHIHLLAEALKEEIEKGISL
jgi:chloramphenicol O-acetyltransferase type A